MQAVRIQNLLAERTLLRSKINEENALLVQLQNVAAENREPSRGAHSSIQCADLQNAIAERDALRQRATQLDQVMVDLQNAIVERDALRQRATQLDQALVELQNLQAERAYLTTRAAELERVLVQLQNLEAENHQMALRTAELERVLVQVQNLQAERTLLLERAHDADNLAVRVQNLEAEINHLASIVAAKTEALDRMTRELTQAVQENERMRLSLSALHARPEVRLGSALRTLTGNPRAHDTEDY
ncbi:MAG: hypothetical protein R3E84_02880 [Pseudomonadales bacterium]